MFCPRCNQRLTHVQTSGVNYWECGNCNGTAVALSLVRAQAAPERVRAMWRSVQRGVPSSIDCPGCGRQMIAADLQLQENSEIDVCRRCQFVWFDAGECQTPVARTALADDWKKALPLEMRERLALQEVERIRERSFDSGPHYGWQALVALLGLPFEYEQPRIARRPIVTWALSALVLLVSAFVFYQGNDWLRALAFVPSEPLRWGGLTVITSFFVHGGIFHLLSNLYFFIVFGDNVEDLVGRRRYTMILLAATLMGVAIHWLGDPQSSIPLVGASGGISGVITVYALAFPKARLGFMFRYYLYFRWLNISARTGFILWLVVQFAIAAMQILGKSRVSALAHLGGCLVGAAYWWTFIRERNAASTGGPS